MNEVLCQGCGNPLQGSGTCSWVSFAGLGFFAAGCGSEESRGKDGRVQPRRAAKIGLGRDAEQPYLNRRLVALG